MSDREAREWFKARVRGMTSEESPWTGTGLIKQNTGQNAPVDRSRLSDISEELLDDGELIGWHGLITIRDEEHIRAALDAEREGEWARSMLTDHLETALDGLTGEPDE